MGKYLLYGIFGVLVLAANKGIAYYKRLQYRIARWSLDEITIDGDAAVKASLYIDIYNPTPVSISVSDIYGNVYLNNQLIGVASTPLQQVIASKAVSRVQVTATADIVSAGAAAIAMLLSSRAGKISFDGFAVAHGVEIPIKVNK